MLPLDISQQRKANLNLITSLAALSCANNLPHRYTVAVGGLISYGIETVLSEGPTYTDRVLKGTKPADLPVQLPTKFELAINLATAKALGVDIPAMLLGRADVIE